MISCDLINRDLVVKLYFFILYLNLCNIFRWENFVYGKDFYIERIYYQIKLYIYCLVFIAFLRIYYPGLYNSLTLRPIIWTSQRQNLSVSNKHGIYMEHITLKFWGSTVQYSQVIKFRLFFIFTHAPCGNVSQQMDIFSSSSNSFQPLTFCSYLAEKTQVLFPPVTRDQPDMTWPHPPPML